MISKKVKKILGVLFIGMIILAIAGISVADDTSGYSHPLNQAWNSQVGNKTQLVIRRPYSGTRYTVKIYDSTSQPEVSTDIVQEIDSDTNASYGGIKNYKWTNGSTGVTPPTGEITIVREDVVDMLRAYGNSEAAKKVESKKYNIKLIVEPYLIISFGDTGTPYRVTTLEAYQEIVEYKEKNNISQATGDNWHNAELWGRVYSEYNSTLNGNYVSTMQTEIYEESPEKYACVSLEYDSVSSGIYSKVIGMVESATGTSFNASGWAGYSFDAEKQTEPEVSVDASENSPFVSAKVDNDTFKVYDPSVDINGNPIPTSEKVYISGDANVYGSISGVKKVSLNVNGKYNGTITYELLEEKSNNSYNIVHEPKDYNGNEYAGSISWLDFSGASINGGVAFDITNEAFGTKSFNSPSKNPQLSKSKSSYKKLELKTGNVTENLKLDEVLKADMEVFYKLQEYAKSSNSSIAKSRLQAKAIEINQKMRAYASSLNFFYNIPSGETATFMGYNVDYNGPLVGSIYSFEQKDIQIPNTVDNRSKDNVYVSNGKIAGSSKEIVSPDFEKVNNIRVHTPITNITTFAVNGSTLIEGQNPEFKAGDKVKIKLEVDNDSEYYKKITGIDIKKYIKTAKIECSICGKEYTIGSSQKTVEHECTINDIDSVDISKIRTVVTAVNINSREPDSCAGSGKINLPDDEYALIKALSGDIEAPIITPSPTPSINPPVVPDSRFQRVSDKVCNLQPTETLIVDNSKFKVRSGHAIPTSEPLTITGTSDLLGKIKGIEKWKVNFKQETGHSAEATYIVDYTVLYDYSYTSGEGEKEETIWVYDEEGGDYDTYSEATARKSELEEDYTGVWIRTNTDDVTESVTMQASSIEFTYTGNAVAGSVNEVRTNSGVLIPGKTLEINNKVTVTYEPKYIPLDNYDSRVTGLGTYKFSGTYDSYEDAVKAIKNKTYTASDFYSVANDKGTVKVNGMEVDTEMANNCPILASKYPSLAGKFGISGGKRSFKPSTGTIDIIPNNTNNGYPTSAIHKIIYGDGTRDEIYPFNGNVVKVHTPIYNDLTIESLEPNQLATESLRDGNKIVSLDEEFKATVTVHPNPASSWKYNDISNVEYYKYVEEVKIKCDVCGQEYVWTRTSGPDSNRAGSSKTFTHVCKPVPGKVDDNSKRKITSTVIAENIKTGGQTETSKKYNDSDNKYTIVQTKQIYVAGKIYDFKVRTTDDPAWKLENATKTNAQLLSKLPIGEKGENLNTAYKNGIKLGYRAYFDLKTLGTASTNVKLTPKLYYVTSAGVIKDSSQFKLFYRDSSVKTSYKELNAQDIIIRMSMDKTNASTNNTDYSQELSYTLKKLNPTLDLKNVIELSGLVKPILLTSKNVFMTKYRGAYIESVPNVSRRWYGEIYVPASTVVTANNATPSDIVQGNSKVYKTGYLLVTFEPIESTINNISYLRYDYSKNSEWNDHAKASVLMQEKAGKTTIAIPGNNTLTVNVPNNKISAPVIIYDVSLRANNDYEQTGTH